MPTRRFPIGHGKTISQPFIVALMVELLDLRPEDRVLEVGTGLGYHAAVLASLADAVYTVELIPELAQAAARSLARAGVTNVTGRAGDGGRGWKEHAPFDKISAAAAPEHVPPAPPRAASARRTPRAAPSDRSTSRPWCS